MLAITETPTTAKTFTEQEARDYLANLEAQNAQRPSVRALGAEWGWDKSKVQRLLSRVESETPRLDERYSPNVSPETDTPSSEQLNNLLTNAAAELDEKIDKDAEFYWEIESQMRIEVLPVSNGGIELHQENAPGGARATIHVSEQNIVRLARYMLYAAGFQNVSLYSRVVDGNVDINDGNAARDFDWPQRRT